MHTIHRLALLAAAAALVVGCTASDNGDSASDDTSGGSGGSGTTVASGPAPGVTDDSIKVGVKYVDLAALGDIVSIDHGDYEAAYNALFDHINEAGGINGRTIEPVIVGVNPADTSAADAACVQLTEDEQVFVAIGFFQGDEPLCYLETHQTAVLGGSMTQERLDRAQAPWFTAEAGSDMQEEGVRKLAEAGELDGTVGVFAIPDEEAKMNDVVLPLLDELGVDVADSAVGAVTEGDVDATNAAVRTVAERFQSEDIDQVLLVGTSGLPWANAVEATDYRPALRITDAAAIQVYAHDAAGRDLSVLDGAVATNPYGGNENIYNLPNMQDCLEIMDAAGVDVPDPATLGPDDPETYLAALEACNNVALLQAMVEAAGDDLNYGTFEAGADGLTVDLPMQPEPATFGPPPAADGNIPPYLFEFDPDAGELVLQEGQAD